MAKYAIGLHYDVHSVRALVVNVRNGREVGTSAWTYTHGREGVIGSDDPAAARQHPTDYGRGASTTVRRALAAASRKVKGLNPKDVIGIGVAAAGSTPLPVDSHGQPLALERRFADEPAAMAWLPQDRTAAAEADQITAYAKKNRPRYLDRCGRTYAAEWFFSKILHCLRTRTRVFQAAHLWVESADWIPAMLTDTQDPTKLAVGTCAAGHKAMFHADWGGYPDVRFLTGLDPQLGELRKRLNPKAYPAGHAAGGLSSYWARRMKLPAGTPVSMGALDLHLGAVGAGVRPGQLVKHVAGDTCDLMVIPSQTIVTEIPWACGLVKDSVLPDHLGLEAGQAAVGDLFRWFAEQFPSPSRKVTSAQALAAEAGRIPPGRSGLLALDWHRGNRSVLCDPKLSGLLVGQTLRSRPGEAYRALLEATGFGALAIINRLKDHHIDVEEVVCCGPLAQRDKLLMQIWADVTGRTIRLTRSDQPCALGAAIAGAVAAGSRCGGYETFPEAQEAMAALKPRGFAPNAEAHAVYRKLYVLYRTLHDAFGTTAWRGSLHAIMKELRAIREQAAE